MANVDLPTHTTLTAATAKQVDINGNHGRLHLVSDASGATVYVRGDSSGGAPVTAVGAADKTWAVFPTPAAWECVPVAPTVSGTTSVSLISSGTPTVHIKPCNCTGVRLG